MMRFAPDVWLTATVAVAVACGCWGRPTGPQLRDIIRQILYEDMLFQDLLSEKIKADAVELPPSIRDAVLRSQTANTGDLDPLVALHRLRPGRAKHYSGQALTASTRIVATALGCLTTKRVAVHVALTSRMFVLQTSQDAIRTRLRVFANLIPRDVDMLMAVSDVKHVDVLLVLAEKIRGMLSHTDGEFAKQENLDGLNEALTTISRTIESSCVHHDMADYFAGLGIAMPEDMERYPEIVVPGQKISDAVALDTIVAWIKENENAVMNLYDLLYLLRTMSLSTWKSLLNYEDMPTADEDFDRRQLPSYRDEIRKILSSRFQATAEVVAKRNDIVTQHEVQAPV